MKASDEISDAGSYQINQAGLKAAISWQGTLHTVRGVELHCDRTKALGYALHECAELMETESLDDLAPLIVMLLEQVNAVWVRRTVQVLKARHGKHMRAFTLMKRIPNLCQAVGSN